MARKVYALARLWQIESPLYMTVLVPEGCACVRSKQASQAFGLLAGPGATRFRFSSHVCVRSKQASQAFRLSASPGATSLGFSSDFIFVCRRLVACCSHIDVVAEVLCKDLAGEVRVPLAGFGRLNPHLRSFNLNAACALQVVRHPGAFASMQGVQVPPVPTCQVPFSTHVALLHHLSIQIA